VWPGLRRALSGLCQLGAVCAGVARLRQHGAVVEAPFTWSSY
jgi:hypothetical protein